MTAEAAKPINESRVEVDRGVFTLRVAAEEAQRITGEQIPLDLMASSAGSLWRYPPRTYRSNSRNFSFQFPSQSGTAQDRSSHCIRQYDRPQATQL